MNSKTYLTAGMIAATFALPASASAATTSASASVRADVNASVRAFEKVRVLTETGRDEAAAAKLRLGLRELRAAARTTARMRRGADGDRALVRVVRAERIVGLSADAGADVLADVVAEADVSVDADMAAAISSLLTIHQRAIDALSATIEVATDSVDAIALNAIVALSANAAGVVTAITDALASGNVSADATIELNGALQLATATVSGSLAILQTISGDVSATVLGSVTAVISQVTAAIVQAQATVLGLVASLPAVATGTLSSVVLPTLNSLLGSLGLGLSAGVQTQVGAGAGA